MRPLFLLASLLAVIAVAALLEGCDGNDPTKCPEPTVDRLALLPELLSETGLFDDVAGDVVGPGVRAFEPQFELESDGAAKRRWVRLPDDAVIDTSDPGSWRFPVGTTFWKEFTKDGVRVETRVLQRVDDGTGDFFDGWVAQAYVWNDDGTDAVAAPEGVVDAKGTTHDVPTVAQCIGCHNGSAPRVLGFSAVQLGFDSDLLDLSDLRSEGRLSDDVTVSFGGDDLDRRALGYLHANCAHCHNDARPAGLDGFRCFDPQNEIDTTLPHRLPSIDDAPLVRDFGNTALLRAGGFTPEPALVILLRQGEMPALGSEDVDDEGLELLREWLARF